MQSESITRFERPIERRPLHEEVADRLRELVTEGVLPPGHHLNERVLCAQLGVSRTPLREAFKVLAAERLIELHPNRGASVAALSARDVAQLFEVMSALEALSGELAARRATDAEIEEVRALHFEMLAAHARRDLPALVETCRTTHPALSIRLCAAAGESDTVLLALAAYCTDALDIA